MSNKFLEVNLHNVYHNIEKIKKQCNKDVLFMAVVKSNAYGHGMVEISKAIASKVDYFGVGLLDEALMLRAAGIKKPILLMSPTIQLDLVIKHQLTLSITSIEQLETIKQLTNEKQQEIICHLKVNTGMNRFGISIEEIDAFFQVMNETSYLKLEGIYSHIGTTYKTNKKMVYKQKAKFDQFIHRLESHYDHLIYHIANSENALDCKEAHYSMIRLGNALYGPCNSNKNIHLKQVGTIKAKIIETKWIQKGETVGYGNYFKASRATQIGIIEYGFYDGLGITKKPLGVHSKGLILYLLKEAYRYMFRNPSVIYYLGKPLKILGIPNMQFTIVDLTHMGDLSEPYVDIKLSPIFIKENIPRNYISEV